MTTVAAIVCDGERFRVLDNGQVQRFTGSGWQRFASVDSDGFDDDVTEEEKAEGICATVLSTASVLHYLYGWRIDEANLDTTAEAVSETDGGSAHVQNAPVFQDASVNFVGDSL